MSHFVLLPHCRFVLLQLQDGASFCHGEDMHVTFEAKRIKVFHEPHRQLLFPDPDALLQHRKPEARDSVPEPLPLCLMQFWDVEDNDL